MAPRWVTLLLDAGLVTEAQVRASEAESSSVRSPELVKNLVAQGLDERVLAGFFVSLGFGPMLQAQELARADLDLLRRLPSSDARALYALPLRPSPAGAIVAMADPTDEQAVARISKALGGTILPTVARFSDLLAAIDRVYPQERPTLVSDAPVRESHPSGVMPLVQEKPPIETDKTLASFEPQLADLHHTASPVWDQAWDRTTGREAAQVPSLPVMTVQDVEPDLAELGRATTRDEVVRLGCEACLVAARGAAFLALRKGVFRGWDGVGDGITSASIRSLWVPASNPSVLNDVMHTGKPFRGPYGQTAADHLLRAALGGQGREALIVPVLIGDRMCGLLCATDPGPDSGPIEAVAQAMGRAFQRLIVSKKAEG